jgi:hypothetical protein
MISRSYVFIQQLSSLHIKSLGVVDNRISRLIPPQKNLAQEKRGGGRGSRCEKVCIPVAGP